MLLENKQEVIKMKKDKLIKLLKDDEIQKVIIDIINNSSETTALASSNDGAKIPLPTIEKDLNKEIEMLKGLVEKFKKCFADEENKNIDLLDNLKDKDSELSNLISQKETLENDINKLENIKKEMKNSNKELNLKVEFYRNNFEDDLRAYEIYQTLNSSTKSSLDGIFKDSSLQGFIACGIQDKNISSLWDYIQNELRDNSNSDIANLIKIFDFLFSRYIIAYPIFSIQNVNIDDKFDTDDYIRDNSSNAVSGNISQIVLRGWVNKKTNKIIKKSVVKVG